MSAYDPHNHALDGINAYGGSISPFGPDHPDFGLHDPAGATIGNDWYSAWDGQASIPLNPNETQLDPRLTATKALGIEGGLGRIRGQIGRMLGGSYDSPYNPASFGVLAQLDPGVSQSGSVDLATGSSVSADVFVSNVAPGSPPFTAGSDTMAPNLNSQYLADSQEGTAHPGTLEYGAGNEGSILVLNSAGYNDAGSLAADFSEGDTFDTLGADSTVINTLNRMRFPLSALSAAAGLSGAYHDQPDSLLTSLTVGDATLGNGPIVLHGGTGIVFSTDGNTIIADTTGTGPAAGDPLNGIVTPFVEYGLEVTSHGGASLPLSMGSGVDVATGGAYISNSGGISTWKLLSSLQTITDVSTPGLTINSDNWLYWLGQDATPQFGIVAMTVGDPEPTIPSNAVLLAKVRTNSSNIIAITDERDLEMDFGSREWHVGGLHVTTLIGGDDPHSTVPQLHLIPGATSGPPTFTGATGDEWMDTSGIPHYSTSSGWLSTPSTPNRVDMVLDYGADPTGQMDVTILRNTAALDLYARGGGTIYWPRGKYLKLGQFIYPHTGLGITKITGAVWTSGESVTFTAPGHKQTASQKVGITGITPTKYNGTYAVTGITSTTFTANRAGSLTSDPGYVSGGIVYPFALVSAYGSLDTGQTGDYNTGTIGKGVHLVEEMEFNNWSWDESVPDTIIDDRYDGTAGNLYLHDLATVSGGRVSITDGSGGTAIDVTPWTGYKGNLLNDPSQLKSYAAISNTTFDSILDQYTTPITAATSTNDGTYTYITITCSNSFAVGQTVNISGCSVTGYNGAWVVLLASSTVFTARVASAGPAFASASNGYALAGTATGGTPYYVELLPGTSNLQLNPAGQWRTGYLRVAKVILQNAAVTPGILPFVSGTVAAQHSLSSGPNPSFYQLIDFRGKLGGFDCRGMGTYEWRNMCVGRLRNDFLPYDPASPDNSAPTNALPILKMTQTTPCLHNFYIHGAGYRQRPNSIDINHYPTHDGIELGGPGSPSGGSTNNPSAVNNWGTETQTAYGIASGYIGKIHGYWTGCRRAVYGRTTANGIEISGTIWTGGAGPDAAAVELSAGSIQGITNNFVHVECEIPYYQFGAKLDNAFNNKVLSGWYDPGSSHASTTLNAGDSTISVNRRGVNSMNWSGLCLTIANPHAVAASIGSGSTAMETAWVSITSAIGGASITGATITAQTSILDGSGYERAQVTVSSSTHLRKDGYLFGTVAGTQEWARITDITGNVLTLREQLTHSHVGDVIHDAPYVYTLQSPLTYTYTATNQPVTAFIQSVTVTQLDDLTYEAVFLATPSNPWVDANSVTISNMPDLTGSGGPDLTVYNNTWQPVSVDSASFTLNFDYIVPSSGLLTSISPAPLASSTFITGAAVGPNVANHFQTSNSNKNHYETKGGSTQTQLTGVYGLLDLSAPAINWTTGLTVAGTGSVTGDGSVYIAPGSLDQSRATGRWLFPQGIIAGQGSIGAVTSNTDLSQLRLIPASFRVGPPASSVLHYKGDFFVDSTGQLYYCTATGPPAVWVNLSTLTSVTSQTAGSVTLTLNQAAGQTAHSFDIKDSLGNVLFNVGKKGRLSVPLTGQPNPTVGMGTNALPNSGSWVADPTTALSSVTASGSDGSGWSVGTVALTYAWFTHVATITAASWAASVATITFSGGVAFKVGETVRITGVTPTGYNGTWTVASLIGTTGFTFALVSDPGGAGTVFGTAYAGQSQLAPPTQVTIAATNHVTATSPAFSGSITGIGVFVSGTSPTSNQPADYTLVYLGSSALSATSITAPLIAAQGGGGAAPVSNQTGTTAEATWPSVSINGNDQRYKITYVAPATGTMTGGGTWFTVTATTAWDSSSFVLYGNSTTTASRNLGLNTNSTTSQQHGFITAGVAGSTYSFTVLVMG